VLADGADEDDGIGVVLGEHAATSTATTATPIAASLELTG
jgi:hypothetical protein